MNRPYGITSVLPTRSQPGMEGTDPVNCGIDTSPSSALGFTIRFRPKIVCPLAPAGATEAVIRAITKNRIGGLIEIKTLLSPDDARRINRWSLLRLAPTVQIWDSAVATTLA